MKNETPVFYLPPGNGGAVDGEDVERLAGRLAEDLPDSRSPSVSWIVRPWQALVRRGMPVRLSGVIPPEGVIVAARGDLPWHLRPSPRQLFVCARADAGPHPWAQLELVQNPAQARPAGRRLFVPHWPQPGLRVRDAARGARFERIGFLGDRANLAPELASPEWPRLLAREGLEWILRQKGRHDLGDYGDLDAVIAIRDFAGMPHDYKPASKLVNAWLAGVPAIVGPESAFLAAGRPGEDFLLAESVESTLAALRALRDSPGLRARLVENGRQRAMSFNEDSVLAVWTDVLYDKAPKMLAEWRALSAPARRAWFLRRWFRLRLDGAASRIRKTTT
jgi:hypothetical protein